MNNYSDKNLSDKYYSQYRYSATKAICLRFLLVLSLVVGISSCTFERITVNRTQSSYEVIPGDSVTIHWSFNNADRVFVDGLEDAFLPVDSARILPENSKILGVWAYKGNLDSLSDKKYIHVKGSSRVIPEPEVVKIDTPPEQERIMEPEPIDVKHTEATREPAFIDTDESTQDEDFVPVQRGPIPLYKEYHEVRGIESEYLRGVTNSSYAKPHTVKICSVISDREGSNLDVRIRFLVLDKYGNFLNNDICNSKQHCELKYSCNDRKYSYLSFTNCRKEYSSKRRISNDISILLDNSIVSEHYQEVFDNIRSITNELAQNDRVQLVKFNHNYEELCDFSDPYSLEAFFDSYSKDEDDTPNGLSSVYKSIYTTLDNFPDNNANKAVIVITHFNDNSSLLYKISDLIEKSKETGIPIYVIAVGDALLTSHLNYVATRSGGAFYHLFSDEIDDIPSIINEIYFAMNNYFEVEFSDKRFPFNERSIPLATCDEMESLFSIELNGTKFECQANIFAFNLPDYFQFQALALFDDKDSYLSSNYYNNLDVLATTMLDNPTFQVEIIGNTGNEGNDNENESLSKKRVLSIIDYLVSRGVPTDRLIPKAMGYRKPLYYRTETLWQAALNRRVELRWLDPTKLPYEIIAEVVDNEAQAKRLTEKWQKSNMRAYYERAVIDGTLKYQVKLWGYKTVQEANKEIKRLKPNNHNIDFRVE